MSAVEPLSYSLREQIVNRLRNDILSSRLGEGELLKENKLVERFGVSRTPIREALLQLTYEGLLEAKPNIGVRVARRPPDAIRELVVPIRRRVEIFALQSYFPQLNAEDFANWRKVLKRMRIACLAQDYPDIAEADIEFHRLIIRRAEQPDLDSIWASLLSRVRSHFWVTQRRNYSDPFEIYEEHERIVKVFESGDLAAAVKALEDNIA